MNNSKDSAATIDQENAKATDATTDYLYNTRNPATDTTLDYPATRPNSQRDEHVKATNCSADAPSRSSFDEDEAATAAKTTAASKTTATATTTVPESAAPIVYRRPCPQRCVAMADMTRRVSFPENDKELVTGCLEPANPWEYAGVLKSVSELCDLYIKSCHKHGAKPLPAVLKQLSLIDLDKFGRHCTLSLGSIKLTPIDCEPLEEIFKRIQFKSVDFSSCELDEGSVGALFEMIEYYEATSELDISSNTAGMTQRGWQSCSNMVGRTQELTVLIAKGNPISMLGSGCLGRALNTSNLHTLKLEHCGLKGPPLTELCIHLHKNDKVRELWLSNNDLDCKDAGNLGDLLKANHYIEFLDISNNNVTNVGLLLIVLALKAQSKELTRLSKSPEVTPPPISVADAIIEHRSVMDSVDIKSLGRAVSKKMDVYSSSSSSRLPHVADIFPESPVRFSSPLTNVSPPPPAPAIVGQSMLDKLLSMNNEAFAGEKTDVMPATLSVPATVATAAVAAPAVTAFSEEAASGSASESKVTPNATATTTTTAATMTATTIQAPTSQTTANDYDATTDCGGNASETPIVEEPLINFTITGHAGDLGEVDQVGEAIDEVHSKNFNRSDDIDDSHSTDSAFESASEGDSSRLMSEPEFGSRRPSDSIRIENSCGEPRNGAKCLNLSSSSANNLVANAGCTPQARANPLLDVSIEHVLSSAAAQFSPNMEHALRGGGGSSSEELTPRALNTDSPPAATTATTTLTTTTCDKDVLFGSIVPKVILRDDPKDAPDKGGAMAANFSTPSLPIQPPSTPTLYTQSMRLHSQSTDSLCSENSLDGSVSSDLNFSTSAQINEKLTKNDTLTRQLRQVDPPKPMSQKRPGGLKALALWNNNLTKESGSHIAQLLTDTVSLELLNIGKNCLSNEFVTQIKESLSKNTTLTTLGLQSTHLSRNGIDTLFSIFGDECESSLKRVDIRDNKVEIENLTTVLEVLKTKHTSLTQIDIDDEPKRLPAGTDEHKQYTQILQNIRAMCTVKGGGDASSETEAESPQRPDEAERPAREVDAPRRGNGFGGRKISLTCYSRPLLDTSGKCVVSAPANEAEVKRTRMRSPLPSPPSVSPSSSPNRSRFQVFRVAESNLLNQPLNNKHSVSTGNLIPRSTTASELLNSRSTTSQSLPTMSAVKPMRSRFQVSRIYEDPQVPISKRDLPPIAKDTTDTTEAVIMRKSASPEGTRATPPPPKPESKPPTPPVEIDTTPPTPSPTPPSTVTPPPKPVASTPPSPTPTGAIIPPSSSTPSMAATSPCPTPPLAVTPPSPTPPLTMAAPTPPPTRSADSPTPPTATLPSVRAATPPPLAPRAATPPPTASKQPSPPPLIEDTPPFVLEPENFVSLCDELAECNECDNEKTLTKDSVAEGLDCRAAVSAAASEPTKKSWISNTMPVEKIFYPAGVERLLTLFHNPFPRNASPDKVEANNVNVEEQQHQNTLVPSRKITPPSWPIFDADNLFNQINSESPPLAPGGDVVKNGGVPGATAPASAGAQSKSLLDVASRHLSDLSKQVFGPFSSTEVNPTPPTVGVVVEENVAPLARVATCTMNHDDEYERSEAADSMTHAQRDDGTGKASTQEDVAGSNPYY